MKVHWNSKLAKLLLPKGFIAITLYRHVFVKREKSSFTDRRISGLLAHEGKHVEQWERYGYLIFPFKYFFQWIKYGYKNMPLEIEAKQAEQ